MRAVVVVLLLLGRADGECGQTGLLGHGVLGRDEVLAGLLKLLLELGLAVCQALGDHVTNVDVGRLGLGLGKANAADVEDRGDLIRRGLGESGRLLPAGGDNEGQDLCVGHCCWVGVGRKGKFTDACEYLYRTCGCFWSVMRGGSSIFLKELNEVLYVIYQLSPTFYLRTLSSSVHAHPTLFR